MTRWLAPVLALFLAAPAAAQQWQVARDQFAFAGRQLTIRVDVETEGTLRIIRGPAGAVRISGRSDTGLTAAGLTADEQLTLTGAGDGLVEYIVSVPERVWVSVRLPDRSGAESMGSHQRSGMFRWSSTAHAPHDHPPSWAPDPEPGFGAPGAYTVLTEALAPPEVAVPDLANVRSLTVRVEGEAFRITASRPLAVVAGERRRVEIRPAGPPMEIAIVVPAGTADFTLLAGGERALVVRAQGITVYCAPSTRQWLSGGRGWVTFTPALGTLECR